MEWESCIFSIWRILYLFYLENKFVAIDWVFLRIIIFQRWRRAEWIFAFMTVERLFEAKIRALITHFGNVRLKIDANSSTLSNTFFLIVVISMSLLLLSSRFIVSEWTAWRTDWFTWWDALRTEVYGSARMENLSTRYNCSTAYRKSIMIPYWKKTSVKCK